MDAEQATPFERRDAPRAGKRGMRPYLGSAALLIATLGLAVTLYAIYALPEQPKAAPPWKFHASIGRLHFEWRSDAPSPPPPVQHVWLDREWLRTAGIILGSVGIALAFGSWARREVGGVGVLAVIVAIAAIAWPMLAFVVMLSGMPTLPRF